MARSIVQRADASKIAFFNCDMQTAFSNKVHEMPFVTFICKRMLEAGKILGIPAVACEQYPQKLGATVPELDISGAFYEEKKQFSMFTPRVKEHLKELKASQVALFGIETHVCILQTALDLLENSYEVYIICDGTSSMRPLDRSAGLHRMAASGAMLTTSESLLFDLMRTAEYPNFKEISKLLQLPRTPSELSSL